MSDLAMTVRCDTYFLIIVTDVQQEVGGNISGRSCSYLLILPAGGHGTSELYVSG